MEELGNIGVAIFLHASKTQRDNNDGVRVRSVQRKVEPVLWFALPQRQSDSSATECPNGYHFQKMLDNRLSPEVQTTGLRSKRVYYVILVASKTTGSRTDQSGERGQIVLATSGYSA